MELVIACDLFDKCISIRFEENEMAQVVQQQLRCKEAFNYFFQLILQKRLILFTANGPPGHEPFF